MGRYFFLIIVFLCFFSLSAEASKTISLNISLEGQKVRLDWQSRVPIQRYILLYAPFPSMTPVKGVNLYRNQKIEATLPWGAAYFVAVLGKDIEGHWYLSNIEYFRVRHIWRPGLGVTWQWQLSGPIDTSVEAEMFDVDLFETKEEVIQELHAKGRVVICYFSAGTYESWRPDASSFPREVIGLPLEDWPDERWLDIRRLDVLGPIMEKRLDMAVLKGCDGVEPDNVDAYANHSGFPLTYEDQLRYNLWLAQEAHVRGLSVGLKNDLNQIPDLVEAFDWALNEECFFYHECEALKPFVQAGKAVFGVEYELDTQFFCPQANAMGFSFMKKHWDLDAWREPCW